MDKQKYIDDFKDIKKFMDRSASFISLSGLSGISMGIIALIGAYAAYRHLYNQSWVNSRYYINSHTNINYLLAMGTGTLILALSTGYFFTQRKARKKSLSLWSKRSVKLLLNLFVPLISGGIFCLLMIEKGYIALVAPCTLIFYGLAIVSASQYSYKELKWLGIFEIVLGLIAVNFIGYGLIFWALGFGFLHILFGILVYKKYD